MGGVEGELHVSEHTRREDFKFEIDVKRETRADHSRHVAQSPRSQHSSF